MATTSGIHHITAITANPQKNLDFYEGFLGQRLVKRTVNFDDPRSYHFYFGDKSGQPGTLMTFFYWPEVPKGKRGAGEVSRIAYGINRQAKDYWIARAGEFGITLNEKKNLFGEETLEIIDPDGIVIDLVLTNETTNVEYWEESRVKEDVSLLGFYGATLSVLGKELIEPVLTELGYTLAKENGNLSRFVTTGNLGHRIDIERSTDFNRAIQGTGSVHHIAIRATNDEEELEMREQILSLGLIPTPVIERNYFRSVYFQTPSNILFEIATDKPGNTVDEPLESLGEKLVLPLQYEPHREIIESQLVPIELPRHKKYGDL